MMPGTDYSVRILMDMNNQLAQTAKTAARAMGELEEETRTAARGLEAMDDASADVSDNLEDMADRTGDSVDRLEDLDDVAGDAEDNLDELGDTAGDAGEQLEETEEGAKKAAKGLEETDKAAGKAEKELGNLAKAAKFAAGAFAAIKTAQAAIQFVTLGAQLIETRERFVAFSGGAARAAENLEVFRTATKGTVSDSQAMVAITKLMGMGLVDNAQQMGLVAQIAVQLGDQTQNAGDRIMSFAQMLATGSTRRLYEYGLKMADVEQRAKDLLATHQGMSKDEAFKLAVLAEGTEQLKKLGEGALSADDKLDRVTAGLANLKDNAAMAAAKLIDASGALDFLSERLPKLPETLDQINVLFKVFHAIPIVERLQDMGKWLNTCYLAWRALEQILKGVVWVFAQVATFIGITAAKNDTLRLAMYNALPAEMQTNAELNKMRDAAGSAAVKANELSSSIKRIPAKKTIDLSFIVRGAKNLGKILGLQAGGIASGLTLVGEQGPELVQLPAGSRVYSHQQTVNNSFNMTVNTRATTGTVMQDYQMMRALVG
jgi:ABC-type transporter Mla subunit MlaD